MRTQTVGLLTIAISRTDNADMNAIKPIRSLLGVSQSELAAALDVSQGNVSFYENGQTIPPPVAAKLIEFAKSKGLEITYEHIYGGAPIPKRHPAKAV